MRDALVYYDRASDSGRQPGLDEKAFTDGGVFLAGVVVVLIFWSAWVRVVIARCLVHCPIRQNIKISVHMVTRRAGSYARRQRREGK